MSATDEEDETRKEKREKGKKHSLEKVIIIINKNQ